MRALSWQCKSVAWNKVPSKKVVQIMLGGTPQGSFWVEDVGLSGLLRHAFIVIVEAIGIIT